MTVCLLSDKSMDMESNVCELSAMEIPWLTKPARGV
jgi:hypothetical protein